MVSRTTSTQLNTSHKINSRGVDAKIVEQDILSTPLSVLLFDLKTMEASVSPGMRELYGLIDSEISLERLTSMIHEDDRKKVIESSQVLIEQGYVSQQYRSYNGSGKLIWIHSDNWVIYDKNQQPTHVVNHVFDISKIKYNEEALSQSISLHRLLMNKSAIPIWRVELLEPLNLNLPIDDQVEHMLNYGYFAEHNPAYANNLGLPDGDISGMRIKDIPANLDEARAHLKGFAEVNYEYNGNDLFRKKWGEHTVEKYIRMWTTPIVENNHLHGFWGMLSDLTEEKKQEEIVVEILQGLSAKTGDEFFDALTRYIVDVLGAGAAFVSRLEPIANTATILSGYDSSNRKYKNVTAPEKYSSLRYLQDLQRNDNIFISADHEKQSPAHQSLNIFNCADSAFCLLKDNQGNELGYLSIFFQEKITDTKSLRNLLQIFSIRSAAELTRDQHERALLASRRELENFANHDSLTGLANRHNFIGHLNALLEAEAEGDSKVGLLLLDLDGFKEVNDTLGHQMGDALLIQLAKRLQDLNDYRPCHIARLGGDEFAFVIENTNDQDASEFAERIMAQVQTTIELANIQLQINGSLGVAIFPDVASTSDKLMSCADVAMYHAKNNSEQIQFYESAIDQYTHKRLALMSDLKTAVQNNEMALVYQPLLDVASNQTYGFEALIRWHHPTYGLVMPLEFIPLAELSKAIHQITEWVVKTVAMQIIQWQNEGYDYVVSINLSAKNLMDAELINRVANIIQQSGIEPKNLELEITESTLMCDIERATRVIEEFKSLGVNSVIDDYGTGYSSLAYLQRLPIEKLKIDRAFVGNMINNPQDKIIVQSTIQLAHNLGKQVVAEGIEDQETLNALKELGCDFAQGYFFSKPMPADYWAEFHQVQKDVG